MMMDDHERMREIHAATTAFNAAVDEQLRKHDRTVLRVRLGLLLIACGALAAWAWLGMPGAKAEPVGNTSPAFSGYAGDRDGYSMWDDVEPFAHSVSVSDAAGFGVRVCSMLYQGNNEGRLVNQSVTQYGVPASAARYLIHAAEWHYCPEYY